MTTYARKKDIKQLLTIKDALEKIYSSEGENVPQPSDTMEKIRSFQIVSRRRPLLGTTHSLTTALDLSPAMFVKSVYTDLSESSACAPMRNLTNLAIDNGIAYIAEREKNPWRRRQLFSPYANMNDPRYYIIYIITVRLQEICLQGPPNKTMIQEYKNLLAFVLAISSVSITIFHSRNAQNGFHPYVYEMTQHIKKMIVHAESKLAQLSIRDHLLKINDLIESYKTALGNYTLITINRDPLPESCSSALLAQDFFDVKRFPEGYTKTQLFKNTRSALRQTDAMEIITPSSKNSGISQHLIKLKFFPDLLLHYNRLLKLLFLLQMISENYKLIAESIRLEGEYQLVHNANLYNPLIINLSILETILDEVQQHINFIESHNTEMLQENRICRMPGFIANKTRAFSETLALENYSRYIKNHRLDIEKIIMPIKKIPIKNMLNQRERIIDFTREIISRFITADSFHPLSINLLIEKVTEKATALEQHKTTRQLASPACFFDICQTIISANDRKSLSRSLIQLQTMLLAHSYSVGRNKKKVDIKKAPQKSPKHIKILISHYQQKETSTLSFKELKKLRQALFSDGRKAAKNPPIYCFGLLRPRSSDTQNIYDAFVQSSGANTCS